MDVCAAEGSEIDQGNDAHKGAKDKLKHVLRVLMYLPSEVPRGCLKDRRRHRGHVGSHVVLEATLTNEAQQAL